MTAGYTFTVDCLDCGTPLRPLVESRHTGTETTASARCDHCGNEWYVAVHLRRLPTREADRKRQWRAKEHRA